MIPIDEPIVKNRTQAIVDVTGVLNRALVAIRMSLIALSGPDEVLVHLRAASKSMEDVGFAGSARILATVNAVAQQMRWYASVLSDAGRHEAAALVLSELSALYSAGARAVRFRRPSEEVRALRSPGLFWALRSLQLHERARLAPGVSLPVPNPAPASREILPRAELERYPILPPMRFVENLSSAQSTHLTRSLECADSFRSQTPIVVYQSPADVTTTVRENVLLELENGKCVFVSSAARPLIRFRQKRSIKPLDVRLGNALFSEGARSPLDIRLAYGSST